MRKIYTFLSVAMLTAPALVLGAQAVGDYSLQGRLNTALKQVHHFEKLAEKANFEEILKIIPGLKQLVRSGLGIIEEGGILRGTPKDMPRLAVKRAQLVDNIEEQVQKAMDQINQFIERQR